MLGVILSILVIVWVGWMIARKGYAAAVLLIAGIFLLTCAVLFDLQPGIVLKKATTGNAFFDIYKVVEQTMSTTLAGLGLSIMCMGGFARYMDTLSAGRALYDVVGGPLKYVKSPYLLACMGFIVTQIIGTAIPSAAGLGLMLMVTLYPVLIRAGVSRMTAVCIIAASRFFDLGPGSANCMLAAKTSNIEWAEYFLGWQLKIYVPLLITMLVAQYFTQKYWDSREGIDEGYAALQEQFRREQETSLPVPKIYSILPLVPLFILLIFNPVVIGSFGYKIKVGVPAAIVLSVIVSMIFEWIRKRDGKETLAGLKSFFEGMGKQFAVVVALIVAGQVFGKGLIATGSVDAMITATESSGLGVGFLVIVMTVIIGVVAFLMGSGNAPFFSFASLVPSIAAKFGVHSADILLPLQTMTGFGRTMSPVTGAIVAVSGIAGVSPFQVVKRNFIPLILCVIVNYILTFTIVL